MKTVVTFSELAAAGRARLWRVLVVTRYRVPPEENQLFRAQARDALDAFAAQPGHVRGRVGRSADEPDLWVLVTEWENVGAYRRALSAYDVKMRAVPVMYRALVEPTAYELLERTDHSSNSGDSGDPDRSPAV
jgi:quinol monooxygenase YgiN